MWPKPDHLFDRDVEWAELSEFASSDELGATLGLVYGRRQGRTLLLELLALETGGFMFGAPQQTEAQNLADLGAAYAAYRGLGVDQLRRLEHLRGLLPSQRVDQPPKLLLFSRAGFTAGVADEAVVRPGVELIGIDRLYDGG